MARSVKTQKRRYRSRVREEQALATRERVLDAAYRLFVGRGYAATTIASVAAEAGVAPETIYVTFGSKRALLEGVIDQTIMGPQAPVSLPEQLARSKVERLPTPRERLRAHVEFACGVLARTSPVHAVIRGAADADGSLIALRKRLLAERIENNSVLRKYLAGGLRPGLTFTEAIERFVGLSSPEIHYLVTVDMGWTREQHCEWLFETASRDLLRPNDSEA